MSEGAPLDARGPGPALAARPHSPPPTEHALPLSGLAAFAALCAMALNQVVLPALGQSAERSAALRLDRAGQFAANLAVMAGLISLVFGVLAIARREPAMSRRRKVLGALFLAILTRAVVVATLFERSATTAENVYLALGAANLLAVLIGTTAIEQVRAPFTRVVAGLATALPLFAMFAFLLEASGDLTLDPWKQKAHVVLGALGELSYLALLLVSFPLLVPRAQRARDLVARAVGVLVLVAALWGVRTAYAALPADYGVLLYSAQRVGFFLERFPLVYALPFCLALSAMATALCSGHAARTQAGIGMLLCFASGYAPRSPGRMLTMTLGMLLLARALIALDQLRRARTH